MGHLMLRLRNLCVLCLGQLKFFQSVLPQMISGQVFPGHQSNHLKNQRQVKPEVDSM